MTMTARLGQYLSESNLQQMTPLNPADDPPISLLGPYPRGGGFNNGILDFWGQIILCRGELSSALEGV